MHGMTIGFLAGLVNNANTLPGFGWFKPCLAPKDIVYIGTRMLSKGEKIAIKKLGIKAFTVSYLSMMLISLFLRSTSIFGLLNRCMMLIVLVLVV